MYEVCANFKSYVVLREDPMPVLDSSGFAAQLDNAILKVVMNGGEALVPVLSVLLNAATVESLKEKLKVMKDGVEVCYKESSLAADVDKWIELAMERRWCAQFMDELI